MKNIINFTILLIIGLFLSSCNQSKKDNSLAKKIVVKWEEVSLLKNPDGSYATNSEFVGKDIIPHVWNNVFEYGNMDLAYRIANAGYDLVLYPASNFYLDDAYDKDPKESGAYWSMFANTRNTWTFAPCDMFKTITHTSYGREIKENEYIGLVKLKPD
jgi:hexosaminidase